MTNGEIVTKGGVGTSASIGAWYLSHLQHVNGVLSTISLVIGITIGLVTLYKLVKKRFTKNPAIHPSNNP